MANDIVIKFWQQVDNLSLQEIINNYEDKNPH